MLSGADPVAHWAGSGRTADPRPWSLRYCLFSAKAGTASFLYSGEEGIRAPAQAEAYWNLHSMGMLLHLSGNFAETKHRAPCLSVVPGNGNSAGRNMCAAMGQHWFFQRYSAYTENCLPHQLRRLYGICNSSTGRTIYKHHFNCYILFTFFESNLLY